MARESRLISLASILIDDVLQIPHLPHRNGDVIASNNYRLVGGGLNILVAAKRLGLSSGYAGSHGQGTNSDAIRAALSSENIEILTSPQSERDSGICITFLEPDGARTFVTCPGIEAEPRYSDLADLELFEEDFIYISGYDLVYPLAGPVLEKFLRERVTNQRIIFDPGPLVAEIPNELLNLFLRRSAITSCNEDEHQFLISKDLLGDIGGAFCSTSDEHAFDTGAATHNFWGGHAYVERRQRCTRGLVHRPGGYVDGHPHDSCRRHGVVVGN